MVGVGICIILFILLAALLEKYGNSRFMLGFDVLYEKIYKFYGDILGKDTKQSIKTYIVTLFFVILIANLAAVMLDFIAPIFGSTSA